MKRERHEGVGPVRRAAAAGALRFHADQCGQAIYIVVMYMFLLLGLLLLVINSGEKVNHKIEMQGAADSAAATGAAWYARGLNVISMCNVAETQLLSLVIILDTLETTVPVAKEVIDDLVNQGRTVVTDPGLNDSRWWTRRPPGAMGLTTGDDRAEQATINKFNDLVTNMKARDLFRKYLAFDTGILWQCMYLLDGFSNAMVAETPRAAVREAVEIASKDADGAKKNNAKFAFITPFWPVLPIDTDTRFDDFKEPMSTARMPSRLQPQTPDGWGNQIINGFRGMGYISYRGRTLGPWAYFREPIASPSIAGLFGQSRLSVLFDIVSRKKLDMMFGSTDDRVSLRNWEMDYEKFRGLDPADVVRTWWERVSFDCRYPQPATDGPVPWGAEDAGLADRKPFPVTGDWDQALKNPMDPVPSLYRYAGKSQPSLGGFTRATQASEGADSRQAVWYRVTRARRAHYPEIDIFAPHPPFRDDGSRWPYTEAEKKTYWRVEMWRFDGAELETDFTLHRDYMPQPGVEPIKPLLFTKEGDNKTEYIDKNFTFNGYAYRSGKATNWVQRFINPNPVVDKDGSAVLVCYAQARVYNPISWDPFSQHWKVKLMRAESPYTGSDRWSQMLQELNKGIPSQATEAVAGLKKNYALDNEHVKPVLDMVSAYTWDFVQEFTH
jgi:hypothetical protein